MKPAALTYAGLVTWAQRMGALSAAEGERLQRAAAARPRDAAAVLAWAVEVRIATLRIFTAVALEREPPEADLAALNRALEVRRVGAEADGFGWHWGGAADTLERILWPLAQSAAELLTSGDYRRVRQCGSRGCYQLFVYQNSRRVWCDPNTCGNRAKGRRHAETRRQVRKQLDRKSLRKSARQIEEYRRQRAARGEVAEFDQEDPEFGVWSDQWSDELKEALKRGSA